MCKAIGTLPFFSKAPLAIGSNGKPNQDEIEARCSKMFKTQLASIQKEAENLLFQMNGGKKETLKVEPSFAVSAAGVDSSTKILLIHPGLFVSERILGKWMENKNFPSELKTVYTKLNQNTKLCKRAKHFILAHEMAHLYHKHKPKMWEQTLSNLLMIPTAILTSASLSFVPFLATLLSIRTLAVVILKPLRQYSEQYKEHEADLTALRTTKDIEAAKYFFESIKPLEKGYSWSHPSSEKSLEYLEKHV